MLYLLLYIWRLLLSSGWRLKGRACGQETSTEMQQISEDNPAPLNLSGMELTVRDTPDYMQTLSRENKSPRSL